MRGPPPPSLSAALPRKTSGRRPQTLVSARRSAHRRLPHGVHSTPPCTSRLIKSHRPSCRKLLLPPHLVIVLLVHLEAAAVAVDDHDPALVVYSNRLGSPEALLGCPVIRLRIRMWSGFELSLSAPNLESPASPMKVVMCLPSGVSTWTRSLNQSAT